ncbi:DUF7064 domain-containing protein [Nocardia niigatensis]|uniref:DUF7064 domain-containing protein n=1 Tax=Nocardia niigatensis TaxID=209249 RepID=UPI0005941E96|nr:phosphotransferase [Nocardia niigatensis]
MPQLPVTDTGLLIKTPEGITGDWLAGVLALDSADITGVERIGTGQMSQNYRVEFTHDAGGGSVVVKVASDDDGSRATGVGMGAYFREIAFYRELGGRLGGSLPRCHLAVYDQAEGWFTLVLEDIADAAAGDQIAGCAPATAHTAVRELARLHAPVFNDVAVGTADYLNLETPINQTLMAALLPGFLDRYADRISAEQAAICGAYVAVADAHTADRRPPLGLVHGDFRLDNLLFAGDRCTVVDWQTMTWGPVMLDAAYFLGGALEPDVRKEHEHDIVRTYYDELMAQGVTNFTWEQCWEEYRRQTFWALAMIIVPAMVVVRTDRGDDMFMALLERVCRQISDLGALELLPDQGSAPAPLQPDAADERPHSTGSEPLWNESWYFDAVTDNADTGVYARLGRLPNQDESLVTVSVVRAGRPAVMLVDAHAPMPAGDGERQIVEGPGYRVELGCDEPLRSYRVVVRGRGESFDDHSAPLRGEAGDPIDVEFDLTWTTEGVPYAWRASTRYEIPCRVTGSVRVGDETFRLDAVGQRDHSWGSRDWWANDWMWNAFHLQDGTHTHAVTIPQLPGFAVGYVQKNGQVTELTGGTTEQDIADNGLITEATMAAAPGPQSLAIEPIAWGALRMLAPDGRVAYFPRAMAKVRTCDGIEGVGWIEWNINQEQGA